MRWAVLAGADPAQRDNPSGRRDDVLLAGGYLAAGLLLLWGGVHGGDPAGGAVTLVAPLVLGCATLLWRRTAPVPALLAGVGAVAADLWLGPSLGTIIVFTQILYDVGLYGRPWLLTWLLRGSVLLTSVVLAVALAVRPSQFAVAVALQTALVLVGPPVTAVPVRRYREKAQTERERAEQVARLAELDRRHAVAAERARMARELHDVVANHLSAIALHATAAQSLDLDRAALERTLRVMRDNSVQGLREMRRMVEFLRDPGAEPDPSQRPRLSDAAALVEGAAGVDARLAVTGPLPDLPVAVDLAAYRIVQESVTNAARHAPGSRVTVTLAPAADRLEVTVDSAGGTPAHGHPGGGMGLVGMRERATLLGGDFAAGPYGGGWRVRASLPLDLRRPDEPPAAGREPRAGGPSAGAVGAAEPTGAGGGR